MRLTDLRHPRRVLLGPGYLPSIKTELTLSAMQKTPILFNLVWLRCRQSRGEKDVPVLATSCLGSTTGAPGFTAPFLGVAFQSSSSWWWRKYNHFWDRLQKMRLQNLETGWWTEQGAGNSSALAVCLGLVKSDLQLAAPVPPVTLDYRPLRGAVTAPIFSSNSPSAK